MINLTHAGYESVATYNLTHPTKRNQLYKWQLLDQLRWFLLKLPKYSGRCYKKDYPDEPFWGPSDEYFTYYKGTGSRNKGDRMVVFYMKERELTRQDVLNAMKEMSEEDETLY